MYSYGSALRRYWLGSRKGIRPVKMSGGVLAWLSVWSEVQCTADLHMAQLKPMLFTVSCFTKSPDWFNFILLVPAHPSSPGQRAVERVCVCVCVCACACVMAKRVSVSLIIVLCETC